MRDTNIGDTEVKLQSFFSFSTFLFLADADAVFRFSFSTLLFLAQVQCFGRKEAVLQLLVGGERGQKITDRWNFFSQFDFLI